MSDNSSRADNQQVSRNVYDDYFSGFVDGEGCFYVGFGKRSDLPLGWQIITEFHVSQNPGSKSVLEMLQKRLGCGYLKPNHAASRSDKTWILIVKERKDLISKVIPFFDHYPLQTTKHTDYRIFKKVIEMIEKKRHLKKEGFRDIVNLVFSNKRETNKRYTKKMLLHF
ncbi:MAG: LAGLIDADG homing endonuclease [Candidatus Gottesmanbacteria bacterium GW2011_GWA1_44_24b]|uniref:LAGLIDADG homing endonuclease n=1 Tax=Candidatus Gottesmanbacteria bacterium GW2011_GWA1_44_24b TaxID=1618437 RepID=A0A0G1KL59_9BACT|nr:MAG: LAGLIDADG homing endonuclease [Candidatus Gottesmanbacteria bacterium GW2011_GWA1_44_24b]HCM82110.1 hypothetical protein [Patescibacteria group bacterium]